MANIFTPTNQKRLTNVCVVRLKKHGLRFEIACYPNKVMPWRNKIEKDISEVLQSATVFSHVGKGKLAKKEDLMAAFNTEDHDIVAREILAHGEIQVTEKERSAAAEARTHDVADSVASQCVLLRAKGAAPQPLSVAIVEKAMRELHIALRPTRSTKQLTLDVMKQLKEKGSTVLGGLEIQRCQMRIRVQIPVASNLAAPSGASITSGLPPNELKKLRSRLVSKFPPPSLRIENESHESDSLSLELLCDPGVWREIESHLQTESRGTMTSEVLSLKEVEMTPEETEGGGADEVEQDAGSSESEGEHDRAPKGASQKQGAAASKAEQGTKAEATAKAAQSKSKEAGAGKSAQAVPESDEEEEGGRARKGKTKQRARDRADARLKKEEDAGRAAAAGESDEEGSPTKGAPKKSAGTEKPAPAPAGEESEDASVEEEEEDRGRPVKSQVGQQKAQAKQPPPQSAGAGPKRGQKKKGKGKKKEEDEDSDEEGGRGGRRRGRQRGPVDEVE